MAAIRPHQSTSTPLLQDMERPLYLCPSSILRQLLTELHSQHRSTCTELPPCQIHLNSSTMQIAQAIEMMLQTRKSPSPTPQDVDALSAELESLTIDPLEDGGLHTLLFTALSTNNDPFFLSLLELPSIQNEIRNSPDLVFVLAEQALMNNSTITLRHTSEAVHSYLSCHPIFDDSSYANDSLDSLLGIVARAGDPTVFHILKMLPTCNRISLLSLHTFLRVAAGSGHAHITDILLSYPGSTNILGEGIVSLYTILSAAAENGHSNIVKSLSSHPEFPNISVDSFALILTTAASNGDAQLIDTLALYPQFDQLSAAALHTISKAAIVEGHLPIVTHIAQHPNFSLDSWISTLDSCMKIAQLKTALTQLSSLLHCLPDEMKRTLLTKLTKVAFSKPPAGSSLTEAKWGLIIARSLYPKRSYLSLNAKIALHRPFFQRKRKIF